MKRGTVDFILKKAAELLMTLVLVTMISFLLMRLSPVDPATAYVRRAFTIATEDQVSAMRIKMGLDKPLAVQYLTWVKDALHLDFGKSFVNDRAVFGQVMNALGVTAAVVMLSGLIQVIGILAGSCLCYIFRKHAVGKLFDFLCIAGLSVPAFYLASSFIDVFAVKLALISVAGNQGIMRYFPAALCLSVSGIGFFSQLLARQLAAEMRSDSADYARCRGLSERRILLAYALPQAAAGLLPNFMQMLGICMAGSTIVERIFSLPGLGYLIVESVLYRDSPLIHATILFLAFSLVIFNIISDLLKRVLLEERSGQAEGAG